MSPRIRHVMQIVLITLLLGTLTACIITPLPPTATPAPGPESTDDTSADVSSVDDFADRLTLAIINRDYDQLQSMMGDPFVFGFWLSEGFVAPPAEAVEQFRVNYTDGGHRLAQSPALSCTRHGGANHAG